MCFLFPLKIKTFPNVFDSLPNFNLACSKKYSICLYRSTKNVKKTTSKAMVAHHITSPRTVLQIFKNIVRQSRIMLRQNSWRLNLSSKCNTVKRFSWVNGGKMERERKRRKQYGVLFIRLSFYFMCLKL